MPNLDEILLAPPPNQKEAFPSESSVFPMLLRKAWYGLNQAFRRRIAHLNMTPDQYTVLRTLRQGNEEGLTQKQLTSRMSSDPNTIASLLDRMERAGFIERKIDRNDRRARRILLESGGNESFQKAKDIAIELQDEILQSLSDAGQEQFLQELTTIADACREAAEKSPRRSFQKD